MELGVGGVEGVGPVEGDEPYRAVGLDQYRIAALWLCHVTPGRTKSLWYDNSPPSLPTRLEATMTATHPSTITVEPIAGALGAEISGVDLASDLDDAVVAEIRRAWLEHLVVFFRDQVPRTPTSSSPSLAGSASRWSTRS